MNMLCSSTRNPVFWLCIAMLLAELAIAHDTGPEHLVSFDTELTVQTDGTLDVVHRVAFHPHGDEIQRGLYFELPDAQQELHAFRTTIDVTSTYDGAAVAGTGPGFRSAGAAVKIGSTGCRSLHSSICPGNRPVSQ